MKPDLEDTSLADGGGALSKDQVMAAVADSDCPDSLAPDIHGLLINELQRVLESQDRDRFTTAASGDQQSKVKDLMMVAGGDLSAMATWTYENPGDYDQNSEVNINDLTPVGVHLGKTESSPDWLYAMNADGDGNGEINISDVTTIGQNFLAALDGYYLETAEAIDAGLWSRIGTIEFETSLVPVGEGRRRFAFKVDVPVVGHYYRVVPFRGSETGIPGEPILYTGEAGRTVTIGGRVTDEHGYPMPGIEVVLSSGGSTTTDAEGKYILDNLNIGISGTLSAVLPGYSFTPEGRTFISVTSNLEGQDFNWNGLPKYLIYIDQALIDVLDSDVWTEEYQPGACVINGQQFNDVGLRYRGASARLFPKKSWKVSFADNNEYNDVHWGYSRGSINLNAQYTDTTLIREVMSYQLMQDLGVLAPRARLVRVYINDQYAGLFTDVENPRKSWLDYFGVNDSGSLYQAQHTKLEELSAPEDYAEVFEKQLREDEPFDDLAAFISAINGWNEANTYIECNTLMDTSQLTKSMTAYSLISMADHINTNFFLYNDFNGTGKWMNIPWDLDRTWGHQYDQEEGYFSLRIVYDTPLDYGSFNSAWSGGEWGNVLYDKYLNDPTFWDEYTGSLDAALSTYFTEDRMNALISYYYLLARSAALDDQNKWGSNDDYEQRIEDLREYVRLRIEFVKTNLASIQ